MKRIFGLLCSLLLVVSLAACNNNPSTPKLDDLAIISSPNQTQGSSSETENTESQSSSAQEQISLSDKQTSLKQEQAPPTQSLASQEQESSSPPESSSKNSKNQIQMVTELGNVIEFTLNNSTAAKDFYSQLPLEIAASNYASNEKVFYPPNKLNTSDTPMAKGPTGTLAYYEPWGNVAVYYGDCGGASGLYELGNAISGTEHISTMSGIISISAVSNSSQETALSESSLSDISQEENVKTIQVTVGNKTFTATLSGNASADAFVELFRNEPLVINMSDYSGFEKVGSLGTNLPTDNSHITTAEGDIILYNENQICVFYGSNSWSYTRLAKIDDLSGWKEALGSGDVTITFSLL